MLRLPVFSTSEAVPVVLVLLLSVGKLNNERRSFGTGSCNDGDATTVASVTTATVVMEP